MECFCKQNDVQTWFSYHPLAQFNDVWQKEHEKLQIVWSSAHEYINVRDGMLPGIELQIRERNELILGGRKAKFNINDKAL